MPANKMYSPWTDERLELLKKLAAEGFSNAVIAAELGLTRNAVIGKRAREDIPTVNPCGGPTIEVEKRSIRARQARERRAALHLKPHWSYHSRKVVSLPKPPFGDIVPLNVNLIDLESNHCRYPTDERGENGLMLFCGHPQQKDSSYCECHRKLTTTTAYSLQQEYLRSKQRERKAA